MGQRSATETRTPRTTERPFGCPEITERIPGGSVRGIHADPRPFEPLDQLTDVDLILLGRVSLLRILLSVISGHPKGRSVVPRSSSFPESSPRLGAPARPCGRGRLARFSLPQRFAVWSVALPWSILPVPAVPLALCRVVEKVWSMKFNIVLPAAADREGDDPLSRPFVRRELLDQFPVLIGDQPTP